MKQIGNTLCMCVVGIIFGMFMVGVYRLVCMVGWLGWSGVAATVVAVVNSVLDRRVTLALLVFLWVLALAVTMTIRPQPRQEPTPENLIATPRD